MGITSRDFVYWLQGFFELSDSKTLTESQTDLIRRHLAMVFIHEIDPSFPEEQQKALDDAHMPPKKISETTVKKALKKAADKPGISAMQSIQTGLSSNKDRLYRC